MQVIRIQIPIKILIWLDKHHIQIMRTSASMRYLAQVFLCWIKKILRLLFISLYKFSFKQQMLKLWYLMLRLVWISNYEWMKYGNVDWIWNSKKENYIIYLLRSKRPDCRIAYAMCNYMLHCHMSSTTVFSEVKVFHLENAFSKANVILFIMLGKFTDVISKYLVHMWKFLFIMKIALVSITLLSLINKIWNFINLYFSLDR